MRHTRNNGTGNNEVHGRGGTGFTLPADLEADFRGQGAGSRLLLQPVGHADEGGRARRRRRRRRDGRRDEQGCKDGPSSECELRVADGAHVESRPLAVRLMDQQQVLVVVSVLQGRNFHLLDHPPNPPGDQADLRSQHEIVFQARFLDEELFSDPIALTCPEPPACMELGWEVTRKALHHFRVERKPIKLQAFLLDSLSREKKLIGYWIFDIRSAQESEDPKFEWKPLLNPKFRGNSKQRPEVLCALQLMRSDVGEGVADDSLADSPKSFSSISDPSLLENDIQIREEDGLFRIWDSRSTAADDLEQIYTISIHFMSLSAVRQLLEDNNNGDSRSMFLYLQFALFGKCFKTDGFDCQMNKSKIELKTEKKEILLAVESAHAIRAYFQLYPDVEVSLCRAGRFLASATVPIGEVFTDKSFKPLAGDFILRRSDEVDTSEPRAAVGVQIQVTPVTEHNGVSGVEEKSRKLRHFCFSMDIRGIQPIALPHGSFVIQYLYATFGCLEKVQTSPVRLESKKEAVTFHDGYCAFNFVSNSDKLAHTFAEVPLLLELVDKDSRSSLTAICKLDLSQVDKCDEDLEGKKLLVIKPFFVDANGDNVAQVTVICCLRDMGSVDSSSLAQLIATRVRDADVFEQLYVTAAVEVEVWKQQQKHKFQKKLMQSLKSQGNTSSLEQELRECLERVRKHEEQLEDKKHQLDKIEDEYLTRTQKLGDEISQAVLQVQVMYESRIEKERQTIRCLEEQNKQLSAELASLKPRARPAPRTQSLARVNSVVNSSRSSSRPRAASVAYEAPKPPVRETRPKTVSAVIATKRPVSQKAATSASSSGASVDRRTCVLNDLKNERANLLRNGLCRSDDPMIRTIEKELRRNGVPTK